jgi:cell division protease FtsH
MSLGFTLIPPSSDRLHETKTHLLAQMAAMMGGRAAEKLIFNETTTGASNDFDQATRIARAMVTDYGMSELGPVNYGPSFDITEYSRGWEQAGISQATQAKIDEEVKKILDQAYDLATSILKSHRKELDNVAQELIKKESLDDVEFLKLVSAAQIKKEKTK